MTKKGHAGRLSHQGTKFALKFWPVHLPGTCAGTDQWIPPTMRLSQTSQIERRGRRVHVGRRRTAAGAMHQPRARVRARMSYRVLIAIAIMIILDTAIGTCTSKDPATI